MGFREIFQKLAWKNKKKEYYGSKEHRAMLKMNKIMDLYLEIENFGYSPLCKFTGDDNYIDARFATNAFLIY